MPNGRVVEYSVNTMLGPGKLLIKETATGYQAFYNRLPITNIDSAEIAGNPQKALFGKCIDYGLCPRFHTYQVTGVRRKVIHNFSG